MAALPPSRDLGLFVERVALPPGWRIVYEPVVASTMNLAREAARRGWPDRSVFVCDYQTAGRGRLDRRWEAPPGLGLLFTILLRSADPPLLATMLASVAMSEALERLVGLEPRIKWPNDLLIGGRKLAGVLAEGYSGPPSGYVLVGCGLNANQDAADLAGIGRAATSVKLAAGRPVHRGELLVVCLEACETWLARPLDERADGLRQAWQERLWGLGERVGLRDAGLDFTATIEGLAADGSLLVRADDGQLRRIVAGELLP